MIRIGLLFMLAVLASGSKAFTEYFKLRLRAVTPY